MDRFVIYISLDTIWSSFAAENKDLQQLCCVKKYQCSKYVASGRDLQQLCCKDNASAADMQQEISGKEAVIIWDRMLYNGQGGGDMTVYGIAIRFAGGRIQGKMSREGGKSYA